MTFLFIAALFTLTPLSLSVYPQNAMMRHAEFRVRAMIERHADNRKLTLGYDGPEYKSSEYQIDGAQRQRVFQPVKPWTPQTPGDYIATATLVRIKEGQERRIIERQPFRVVGMEP